MVRIQDPLSEYDRLERLVREVADEHRADLDVNGWTRKTYDFYSDAGRHERRRLLLRVESFATTNGEVTVFDDDGMPIAERLAARLEQEFDLEEAVIVRGVLE